MFLKVAYHCGYILFIRSSYFFATKNLLSLRVGPSSPEGTENSLGRTVNFCTLEGFDCAFAFALSIPSWMAPISA